MTRSTTSPRAADGRNLVATTLLAASAMLAPLAVHSQPLSGDGYLFKQPRSSFTVRGGYAQPLAGGDVFEHARSNLTLDRGSFRTFSGSATLNIRLSQRVSLLLDGGYSQRSVDTEMRYWIDQDDQPIAQTNSLRRVPVSAGLRFDLTSPGRSVGTLAFIPARVTPYVSAGVGSMFYKFRQNGAFKDDNSDAILENMTLETSGNTFLGYGALGFDFTLIPTVALTTEARYDMARARPSGYSFGGFDRIDLSGVSATVGLTFRY
ncbi:MAG: hypothetical protein ACO1Q7_16960 [Gemmatimonas sp.]